MWTTGIVYYLLQLLLDGCVIGTNICPGSGWRILVDSTEVHVCHKQCQNSRSWGEKACCLSLRLFLGGCTSWMWGYSNVLLCRCSPAMSAWRCLSRELLGPFSQIRCLLSSKHNEENCLSLVSTQDLWRSARRIAGFLVSN